MKTVPQQRVPPRAIRAWQWSAALGNSTLFLIPLVWALVYGMDDPVHIRVILALSVVLFGFWLSGIFLFPFLKWKRWRYNIDRHEIDLQRGVLIHQRTLIPLSRVQHVDTRQGPLLRWYTLASVTISTAATTHEIPALDEVVAEKVRDTISTYARLAEEDV
ncbi:MAG: PH domain-containing protein [Balneolaceae bacterium]